MLTTAEKILESASKGNIVPAHERRHCVAYLMATRSEVTEGEMAETFKVSERTIRGDKFKIRKEKSKRIKEEDVSLVIADILLDFERNVADIERSKKKAFLGSRTYLEHCTAVIDMRLRTTKALQDLGFMPKNLGHIAVSKFNYVSRVLDNGVVETYLDNQAPAQDAEVEDIPEEVDAEVTIDPRRLLGDPNSALLKTPDYLKES